MVPADTGSHGWDDEEDDGIAPAPPPADWAAQLLGFWFGAHGMKDWFRGGPAFDAALGDLAGDWHAALRSLPPESFLTDPDTALAAVLLFDQLPRNLFRGSAEAFATDDLARAIARRMVAQGWDNAAAGWTKYHRLFAYLPFEHSESMEDQRESLRLIATLGDTDLAGYAQKHHDMIARFGRFPHRNAVLGRADRPGEADAIAEGGKW